MAESVPASSQVYLADEADEIIRALRSERDTLRELVREAYEEADLGWLGTKWDERAEKALNADR